MVFKIFLDANVCSDFLLQRKGSEPAEKLFKQMMDKEIKVFITPTILHIIIYYLGKVHEHTVVKTIISNLLIDINIIDCNKEIAINAVNSKFKNIEDALQYYTAMHHKVDFFVTNDKDLRRQGLPFLPIYSPTEYLNL